MSRSSTHCSSMQHAAQGFCNTQQKAISIAVPEAIRVFESPGVRAMIPTMTPVAISVVISSEVRFVCRSEEDGAKPGHFAITLSCGALLILYQGMVFAHGRLKDDEALCWLEDFIVSFYDMPLFRLFVPDSLVYAAECQGALDSAMIYLICHEMAHIYLGHMVSSSEMERIQYLGGQKPHRADMRVSFQLDEIEADARACTVAELVIKHFCERDGVYAAAEIAHTIAAIDILFSLLNITMEPICVPGRGNSDFLHPMDMYANGFDYPCYPMRRHHFRDYFLPRLGRSAQSYALRISGRLDALSRRMVETEYPRGHAITRLREKQEKIASRVKRNE